MAEQMGIAEDVAPASRPQPLPPLKLGMLLVHQGAVTPADLREALDAQRMSGLPIGQQLVVLGRAEWTSVLKALASQNGVPFLASLDPAAIRECSELLGPATARALGLVPFGADADRRHVKVACTAPVPRLAMAAFTELTGWTAEPFLVADSALPALLEAYERACELPEASQITVTSIEEAPARVADMAARTPDATVAQAAMTPYLWVRVQGSGLPNDMFVTARKETAWPAAPTSH